MLLKLFNLFKATPIFTFKKHIHKYIFIMDKAYLRHSTESDLFEIAFKYVDKENKINRQFNFNRRFSETVDTFLNRIATNFEKVANKKNRKKRKQDEEQSQSLDTKVSVCLYLDNAEVSRESMCNEIFIPGNKVTLKLESHSFEVIINSPWVEAITLPNSILATFPVYPSKFETVFTEKSLSTFVWSKSKNKTTWIDVGNDFIYIPTNEEIDHHLKLTCTPKNSISEGPVIEVISTCKIEASPGKCPFELRHQFTEQRTQGNEFRIVTYNILADLYCDSDYTREVLHPYCPPYALSIDYRKQLLLKEIIGYNADLICLQEVDRKVYKYDFEPILSHLNYGSDLATKGNEVAEGLAFFYNKKRFKHLETKRFVFSEHMSTDPLFSDIWEKISKNDKLVTRIMDRGTTLQVNVVETVEHNEILVVANTHLYFHPDADHIRLLHGGIAIRYLEHFINSLKEKVNGKRMSLIFCGDFNSVPECGIYKLYTTGEVPKDFIDYQSNKDEAVEDVEMSQRFKLDSACGTPKYTNFTVGFADCLDYIFYEKTNLSVSQVIPLPSHEEVIENTALPSIVFPSDHIALVSDLKWL